MRKNIVNYTQEISFSQLALSPMTKIKTSCCAMFSLVFSQAQSNRIKSYMAKQAKCKRLYRYTLHSVVYVINTQINAHI